LDLAVFEAGDPRRPTVLMVHGWPDTHHLWNGVAAQLADDFHVVAYDTRGMGASDDPGDEAGFRLEPLADDLMAVADAVSPDSPVHVLAHDWGSVQAWEAVSREDAVERIASFTSISGPSVDHMAHWLRQSFARRRWRQVGAVLAQAAKSAYVLVFVSPLGGPLLRRFGSRRRWQRLLQRTEGLAAAPHHHGDTLPDDMVSGLRYYRANVLPRLRHPRRPGRRTSVPVLQLVATQDRAIRPATLRAADRWVEQLERRELRFGHWVPLTRPDLVAGEAAAFIRRAGTPPVS
jgi:pimeloyl-ACP methyl ester carboxylesterase